MSGYKAKTIDVSWAVDNGIFIFIWFSFNYLFLY